MKRTLTLRRESLAELADAELHSVAGGQYTVIGLSCPIGICVPSLPVHDCIYSLPRDCGLPTMSPYCYTTPWC